MKFEEFKRKFERDDLYILIGFPLFIGLIGWGIGIWIGYGNIPDIYFDTYNFDTMPYNIMAQYVYTIASPIGLVALLISIVIALVIWWKDFSGRSGLTVDEMLASLKTSTK